MFSSQIISYRDYKYVKVHLLGSMLNTACSKNQVAMGQTSVRTDNYWIKRVLEWRTRLGKRNVGRSRLGEMMFCVILLATAGCTWTKTNIRSVLSLLSLVLCLTLDYYGLMMMTMKMMMMMVMMITCKIAVSYFVSMELSLTQ